MKYEGLFLQTYGKSLQMAGEDSLSVIVLERAKLLTSDQVLYTTLGDAYKNTGNYNKAEESYHFASFMQPHTLYPHYLLAKLYSETGQSEKAIDKAKEVINKEAKVESTAVEEIKLEMEQLINKYEK